MSTKAPNIFISWSGPRSKHVARALNEWLPTVLQSARPWFSKLSIEKGSRPLAEISAALESIEVGISCLTPENLTSPWILYEAGALSKRIGQKSRLCTYLLGGLGPEGVAPPLGMFQHTRADKDETKQMLSSINAAISEDPVPEPALDKLFERMWPDLEKEIKAMPAPEETVPGKRPVEDMVAEMLDMMRADVTRRRKADFMEAYLPMFQQLLPYLSAVVQQAKVGLQAQHAPGVHASGFPIEAWGFPGNLKCPTCGNPEAITSSANMRYCPKCGAITYNIAQEERS